MPKQYKIKMGDTFAFVKPNCSKQTKVYEPKTFVDKQSINDASNWKELIRRKFPDADIIGADIIVGREDRLDDLELTLNTAGIRFDRINSRGYNEYAVRVKDKLIESSIKDAYNKYANEKDKEYLKDAIAEMKRYVNRWSSLSAKQKRDISPLGLSDLKQQIKYAEDRLKQLRDSSTVPLNKKLMDSSDVIVERIIKKVSNSYGDNYWVVKGKFPNHPYTIFFVTSNNPTGKKVLTGGGSVEFSEKEAIKVANSYATINYLDKKYGKVEGHKRWMRGETDSAIKDYRSDKDSYKQMEEIPLKARTEMKKAGAQPKAIILGYVGQMEDIIKSADPKIKSDLKQKALKILSDLDKQFKTGVTTLRDADYDIRSDYGKANRELQGDITSVGRVLDITKEPYNKESWINKLKKLGYSQQGDKLSKNYNGHKAVIDFSQNKKLIYYVLAKETNQIPNGWTRTIKMIDAKLNDARNYNVEAMVKDKSGKGIATVRFKVFATHKQDAESKAHEKLTIDMGYKSADIRGIKVKDENIKDKSIRDNNRFELSVVNPKTKQKMHKYFNNEKEARQTFNQAVQNNAKNKGSKILITLFQTEPKHQPLEFKIIDNSVKDENIKPVKGPAGVKGWKIKSGGKTFIIQNYAGSDYSKRNSYEIVELGTGRRLKENASITEVKQYAKENWDAKLLDKLIDIPQQYITEFTNELSKMGLKVTGSGKTPSGRYHLQVITTQGKMDNEHLMTLGDKLYDLTREFKNQYNIPGTFSMGLQKDGYISAGIDLDKQAVKDSNTIKDGTLDSVITNGTEYITAGSDIKLGRIGYTSRIDMAQKYEYSVASQLIPYLRNKLIELGQKDWKSWTAKKQSNPYKLGDKITKQVKLDKVYKQRGYAPGTYDYIYYMKDDAGMTLLWKTTNDIHKSVGNKFTVSGVVKDYRIDGDTVALTRCKILDVSRAIKDADTQKLLQQFKNFKQGFTKEMDSFFKSMEQAITTNSSQPLAWYKDFGKVRGKYLDDVTANIIKDLGGN